MAMIDWSRPIVTNAGKPAKPAKAEGEALGIARKVLGEFSAGISWRWVNEDTGKAGHGFGVRNATPAEILAHPDVWPKWQIWAVNKSLEQRRAGTQPDEHDRTRGWPPLTAAELTRQPITHAAMLAAVERLPEHLDGSAAIAEWLCNQLGVEVPVKRAPWEEACEAWANEPRAECPTTRNAWQAAVEWCVEQLPGGYAYFGDVRRRIMGQEQQP